MIKIEDKKDCCGCWACKNVCPHGCITMKEDDEGFHYPSINLDICTNCGLCERVCPLLKPQLKESSKPSCYVVQNKDKDILRHSTSGGFYSALSQFVIERGGVVFGVSLDENLVTRHSYSETVEGCKKFQGSKYVQSLIGETYQQAKKFLDEDRWVAFSGTPCQIAGLVGFLRGRNYEKLILVDLVCRGTPSPRVLKKYLAYHEGNRASKIKGYLSRDKYYGYIYSTASIFFEDPKENYHKGFEIDFFLRTYFKGLISRPSCHQCHFRTIHRVSDFTIFDCWGAPSVSKSFSKNGATNIFIHSQIGKEIFEKICDKFTFAARPCDDAVNSDGVMILNNPPMSKDRDAFFEDLNNGSSITSLERKYLRTTMVRKIIARNKPLLYKFGLFDVYMIIKRFWKKNH